MKTKARCLIIIGFPFRITNEIRALKYEKIQRLIFAQAKNKEKIAVNNDLVKIFFLERKVFFDTFISGFMCELFFFFADLWGKVWVSFCYRQNLFLFCFKKWRH